MAADSPLRKGVPGVPPPVEKGEGLQERRDVLYEAVRDFQARYKGQLLSFLAHDPIVAEIGADLRKRGAPVRSVG